VIFSAETLRKINRTVSREKIQHFDKCHFLLDAIVLQLCVTVPAPIQNASFFFSWTAQHEARRERD
jgi:hypothetical protein